MFPLLEKKQLLHAKERASSARKYIFKTGKKNFYRQRHMFEKYAPSSNGKV